MTARPKATDAEPIPATVADASVEVPADFVLDSLDSDGNVREGLRLVGGGNLLKVRHDPAGFEKAHRAARRLAWRGRVVSDHQVGLQREIARLERVVDEAARTDRTEADRRASFELRRDLANRQEAFDEGRVRLTWLNQQMQTEMAKACSALASTVERVLANYGSRAKEICDSDPGFFMSSPNDSPPELDGLYREAVAVAGVIERLAGSRKALDSFWESAGDIAELVIDRKMKLTIMPPPRFVRTGSAPERSPRPDLMEVKL